VLSLAQAPPPPHHHHHHHTHTHTPELETLNETTIVVPSAINLKLKFKLHGIIKRARTRPWRACSCQYPELPRFFCRGPRAHRGTVAGRRGPWRSRWNSALTAVTARRRARGPRMSWEWAALYMARYFVGIGTRGWETRPNSRPSAGPCVPHCHNFWARLWHEPVLYRLSSGVQSNFPTAHSLET
jgi:hypothetical protein